MTSSGVRVRTSVCMRVYMSASECLAAQDPYCGWDDLHKTCSSIVHPDVSSCPRTDLPGRTHDLT